MRKRIRIISVFLTAVIMISLASCASNSSRKEKTVMERIRESSAARMELPDGSSIYVDSEIASLRSFADLEIREAPMTPADGKDDWLYRIVFNPSEKVKGTDEIIVSFHQLYVQVGSEYCLPASGVSYDSILEWAEDKFEYFMK